MTVTDDEMIEAMGATMSDKETTDMPQPRHVVAERCWWCRGQGKAFGSATTVKDWCQACGGAGKIMVIRRPA